MTSSDKKQACVDMANALKTVFGKYSQPTNKDAWKMLTTADGKREMEKLIQNPKISTNNFRSLSFREWLMEADVPGFATNYKKILIIMRGIPGSGKSHTAREMLQKHGGSHEGHIFSTDNHWIPETIKKRRSGQEVGHEEETAEYQANFHVDKLQAAHIGNLNALKVAIDQGVSPIILDNTNIKPINCKAATEYAHKAGYEVKIQEPLSPWWKAYAPYLKDKSNKEKLEEFVRILHARQKHGVPLVKLRAMVQDWHPNMKITDILGDDYKKT